MRNNELFIRVAESLLSHYSSIYYRRKRSSINYRLIVDGRVQYTRFTAMWSGDKKHIVIGVENIDTEIKKEKDHLKALNSEKDLAASSISVRYFSAGSFTGKQRG